MYKKDVYIEHKDYGTIAVDYFVNCFNRSFTILFKGIEENDIETIEEQLEDSYDKWQLEENSVYCCEEFMIDNLHPYYKNHIVAVIYDNEEEL